MSLSGQSLLDIQSLEEGDVFSIFESARRIRDLHSSQKLDVHRLFQANTGRYLALVFLEPSTRTRASFEVAGYKLGLQVLCPEFGDSSSRSKGESLVDTVRTIAAMGPDVIAVRSGDSPELMDYLKQSEIPVVNAGSGVTGHPTQALLDVFTVHESLGSVRGQRVLIVGDIRHSRVAQSNIPLLKKMGAEVALCAPDVFIPEGVDLPRMELEEGLKWSSVVMALRIQLERHSEAGGMTNEDFHCSYGLTPEKLKSFGEGLILHPGPINHGVELTSEVLKDPRCRVLKQVENGVYIRAAVLSQIMDIAVEV